MAKRIQFSAHGGPEVLEYVDYTPAQPGPQQVRVLNKAIGLNFIDTYFRSGLYAPPSLPSGLGTEAAGVVEAVGEGVSRLKVGDRVAHAGGPLGAYSEVHTLPEANLVKLPDNISFEQAANLIGTEMAERARDVSLRIYQEGAAWAAERGIILDEQDAHPFPPSCSLHSWALR